MLNRKNVAFAALAFLCQFGLQAVNLKELIQSPGYYVRIVDGKAVFKDGESFVDYAGQWINLDAVLQMEVLIQFWNNQNLNNVFTDDFAKKMTKVLVGCRNYYYHILNNEGRVRNGHERGARISQVMIDIPVFVQHQYATMLHLKSINNTLLQGPQPFENLDTTIPAFYNIGLEKWQIEEYFDYWYQLNPDFGEKGGLFIPQHHKHFFDRKAGLRTGNNSFPVNYTGGEERFSRAARSREMRGFEIDWQGFLDKYQSAHNKVIVPMDQGYSNDNVGLVGTPTTQPEGDEHEVPSLLFQQALRGAEILRRHHEGEDLADAEKVNLGEEQSFAEIAVANPVQEHAVEELGGYFRHDAPPFVGLQVGAPGFSEGETFRQPSNMIDVGTTPLETMTMIAEKDRQIEDLQGQVAQLTFQLAAIQSGCAAEPSSQDPHPDRGRRRSASLSPELVHQQFLTPGQQALELERGENDYPQEFGLGVERGDESPRDGRSSAFRSSRRDDDYHPQRQPALSPRRGSSPLGESRVGFAPVPDSTAVGLEPVEEREREFDSFQASARPGSPAVSPRGGVAQRDVFPREEGHSLTQILDEGQGLFGLEAVRAARRGSAPGEFRPASPVPGSSEVTPRTSPRLSPNPVPGQEGVIREVPSPRHIRELAGRGELGGQARLSPRRDQSMAARVWDRPAGAVRGLVQRFSGVDGQPEGSVAPRGAGNPGHDFGVSRQDSTALEVGDEPFDSVPPVTEVAGVSTAPVDGGEGDDIVVVEDDEEEVGGGGYNPPWEF